MRFLDRFTESVFADQEDGSTIYYPNGRFGSGRIITCEKRKKEVFIAHRRNLLISGVSAEIVVVLVTVLLIWLGCSVTFAFGMSVVANILVVGFQIYFNHREVADLPKTDIKLNIANARMKSVRSFPLIFWKGLLVVGLCLMPFYFTTRIWFPEQLNPFEKTTKYTISVIALSLILTCQGWNGCRSYGIRIPTLKFRETHELEYINCEDEKEQIEELIIKQQPDSLDTLNSV